MARQTGQQTVSGAKIKVTPEKGPPSSGQVQDTAGRRIDDWVSADGKAIWVDVGSHRAGTLTENGAAAQPWSITTLAPGTNV